ncbi:MAG TPA: DUF3828 domain-containing protein [Sphingomicrobium sp.]
MILAALALAAAAPAGETPRGFMERLYAYYSAHGYSPFKHPERVFAPRLLAAIKEDERLAKGEVGYLDGDPVCQCQDADGLKARVTAVRMQGAGKASVAVSIGLTGYKARPAQFSLIRTNAGWRIADVSSPDEKSLLAGLEASNAKQKK